MLFRFLQKTLKKSYRRSALISICCLFSWQLACLADSPRGRIVWRDFDETLFVDAKKQNKFVLLDLEAVWCHWCHVMDKETYSDVSVLKLLQDKYICARVDQDSRPDLSSKYEEYGWPATIIFDSEGKEIVKRSGYLNPARMALLLAAIIKDPSPEQATKVALEPTSSQTSLNNLTSSTSPASLSAAMRQQLRNKYKSGYDPKYGGWGTYQKFLDFDTTEYALSQSCDGGPEATDAIKMARGALDGELNLLDPVFGGLYQYSTDGDWQHPHFEKIMQTQAENMRLYALAYRIFKDQRYLLAAQAIAQYLNQFLSAPDGPYYTSQDADLVSGEHSATYFSLSKAERLAQGLPQVDKHIYARENGWAINGLVELFLATGDQIYLARAVLVADWVIANRSLPNGGFGHGQASSTAAGNSGPYLGDTLAMGRAFLTLYRATGERKWLGRAELAANFIEDHFRAADNSPGYLSERKVAVPQPLIDENVMVARFFNLLMHFTGDQKYYAMADSAMTYLAQEQVANRRKVFVGGILLADKELNAIPLHITVVGQKSDPAALTLFRCATTLPGTYTRVEWFDSKEGPLPGADLELPQLGKAAAFLCGKERCSAPAYDVAALKQMFAAWQK